MMSLKDEQYCKIATDIVSTAGQMISAAHSKQQPILVESKGHNDIVTNIDLLVEDYILQELKKHFPYHKILAEESGVSGDLNSDYLWILDPIDGTKNFARHNPHCCISLALQRKQQDTFETMVGIVYQPALRYMFTAIKDQGAYLNQAAIRVSALTDPEAAVHCLGYGYDAKSESNPYRAKNARFINELLSFRMLGASALDLAYVAAGILDSLLIMHPTKIWDIAAGALLVKEAGGIVMDLYTGNNYSDSDRPLLAGNAQMVQQILARYNQPLK